MYLKNTVINASLLIGSLTLFLFTIEFGLRITGLQKAGLNPPRIFRESTDQRISYELRPDLTHEPAYNAHISTDEHGFRLNDGAATGRGVRTVAVLGDSIAFGYGVEDEETLPAQLQKQVPEYRFLNAAVPGYNPGQQIATYETKVASLAPDALLLVFYWNDLNQSPPAVLGPQGVLRSPDWSPDEESCRPMGGLAALIPAQCWLQDHSAFYKAFRKFASLMHSRQQQKQERTWAEAGDTADPVTEEQLDWYGRRLARLTALLPEDMPRAFVIWPDNHLHHESRPQLKALARENGFTVIDLYEVFGNDVQTLSWDTVHPHPRAIRRASVYIVQQMQQHNVVP